MNLRSRVNIKEKIEAENCRNNYQKTLRIKKIEELRKRYNDQPEFLDPTHKYLQISNLCSYDNIESIPN